MERARSQFCTQGQIKVLREGLRVEFEMEVGVLRGEFCPFGG